MMKTHLLKKMVVMIIMAVTSVVVFADNIPGQSQYEKGLQLYQGYGVGQNFAKAVKMWKKAAKKGHVKAKFSLGYCYANGVGVEKDIEEAKQWYLEAAEQGNADAQYNLGLIYLSGERNTETITKAIEMFEKAAAQEHVRAMNNLAYCYSILGKNWQDVSLITRWLKAAADKGYWKAKVAYDEWAEEMEEERKAAQERRKHRLRPR